MLQIVQAQDLYISSTTEENKFQPENYLQEPATS